MRGMTGRRRRRFALLSATASGGVSPYAFEWVPAGVDLNASGLTVRVAPADTTEYLVTAPMRSGSRRVMVRVTMAPKLDASASAGSETSAMGMRRCSKSR